MAPSPTSARNYWHMAHTSLLILTIKSPSSANQPCPLAEVAQRQPASSQDTVCAALQGSSLGPPQHWVISSHALGTCMCQGGHQWCAVMLVRVLVWAWGLARYPCGQILSLLRQGLWGYTQISCSELLKTALQPPPHTKDAFSLGILETCRSLIWTELNTGVPGRGPAAYLTAAARRGKQPNTIYPTRIEEPAAPTPPTADPRGQPTATAALPPFIEGRCESRVPARPIDSSTGVSRERRTVFKGRGRAACPLCPPDADAVTWVPARRHLGCGGGWGGAAARFLFAYIFTSYVFSLHICPLGAWRCSEESTQGDRALFPHKNPARSLPLRPVSCREAQAAPPSAPPPPSPRSPLSLFFPSIVLGRGEDGGRKRPEVSAGLWGAPKGCSVPCGGGRLSAMGPQGWGLELPLQMSVGKEGALVEG